MIFKGVDNQTVELRILEYQFPKAIADDDANWLRIFLKVNSKQGKWQTVDPSLQTSDVVEIIQWMQDWAVNLPIKYNPLDFLEPNLSFHMIKSDDELKTLKIRFELESRPQDASDTIEYHVDCELSNDQLLQLANDLESESSKYPSRK